MDYKSLFQSSDDQYIFRNVLIHVAGYKSTWHDLEGRRHLSRVVGRDSPLTVTQSATLRWARLGTFFPLSRCRFFVVLTILLEHGSCPVSILSIINLLPHAVYRSTPVAGFVRVLKIHESPRYFSCQNYVLKSP